MRLTIHLLLLFLLIITLCCSVNSRELTEEFHDYQNVKISVMTFNRHKLNKPEYLAIIRSTGNLGGKSTKGDLNDVGGWFEYDFTIEKSGWYELLIDTLETYQKSGYGYEHDYIIDGKIYLDARGHINASNYQDFKVGNVWLSKGSHVLRVQRTYWTGFQAITGFRFVNSDRKLSNRLRLSYADDHYFSGKYVERGKPIRLSLFTDGIFSPVQLAIAVYNSKGVKVKTQAIKPVKLDTPKSVLLELETNTFREGAYSLRLIWNNSLISERDVRRLDFVIIDMKSNLSQQNEIDKKLVKNGLIDCANPLNPPDYIDHASVRELNQNTIRYVKSPMGNYIESGSIGYRDNHWSRENINWYAYRLPPVARGQLYAIEYDYPDDRWRSFVFGVRESSAMDLTLATGIDSGMEYPLSYKKHTATLFFWPRNNDIPRLFSLNVYNGGTAPCSEARLYKVINGLPPLRISSRGERQFAYWFEEHDRWATVFGANKKTLDEYRISAERWAQTASYMGVNILYVSAAVYSSTLYPSRKFNKVYTSPYHPDLLKMLLLVTKKYGIKLIIGLHPQAVELHETNTNNLLYDYEGNTYKEVPTGGPVRGIVAVQPKFNPLHKENQTWLKEMIGEIVERYKEYPSLEGVGMRIMAWVNPSLNNLVSLTWGYGDYTMQKLAQETSYDLTQKSFKARYEFLNSGNVRQDWIQWRCKKLGELYSDIAAQIKTARNNLKYFSLYIGGFGFPDDPRQSGLCPDVLAEIDGVEFINADHGYGRITVGGDHWQNRIADLEHHQRMFDTTRIRKFSKVGSMSYRPALMMNAWYIEDGGSSVRPQDLDMPKSTYQPWISAQMHAAGRSDLERYAFALAETDAKFLANGGNGYYLDFPHVREFMAEFRSLPADDFVTLDNVTEPVTIRYRKYSGETILYMVNREPYNSQVELEFSIDTDIHQLSTDKLVAENTKTYNIFLESYALKSFRLTIPADLLKAKVIIPDTVLDSMAFKIEWLIQFSQNQSILNKGQLSKVEKVFLEDLVQKLRRALMVKQTWRVRKLLNSPLLYRIFQNTDHFPPFVDQPVIEQ